MKKILMTAMLASLMLFGCKSEEPKKPPVTEPTSQSMKSAADKAHEAINKAETASEASTEKAAAIKETVQESTIDTKKATEAQTAPAEPQK